MNQKERMLSGMPYLAWLDGLEEERRECACKLYEFNSLPPTERDRLPALLKSLLGKTGETIWIEPPFRCDYGAGIEIGENFYANYNLTVLDCAKVTIGANVQIGPNVSIYTAGHPIHPLSRSSGYEYALPITIGDNVWIGGSSVVLPGVTIGDNAVIGAGSVVSKDIPPNRVAIGNPCRATREITEDDLYRLYKDQKFDEESLEDLKGYLRGI